MVPSEEECVALMEAEQITQTRQRKFELHDFILPLICLALYVLWSATLPIDLAPDEYMRLPIPFFILNHGYLPKGDELEIINEIWGTSYAFVPYGSSLLSVIFMKLVSFVTQSERVLVWAARMGSVLPACGAVLVCESIGKALFTQRTSPYLFAASCGLLPQAVFCASYLNNEALMVFSIALIIDAWLAGIENDWSFGSLVYLGCGLGICALSYYFAYGYILASIAIYFLANAGGKIRGLRSRKAVLGGALVVFLVAFTIGGWFFVRNAIIHDGDIFGMTTSSQTAEVYAQDGFKPEERTMPKKEGYGYLETATREYHGRLWWKRTLLSSIGMFGYMDIPLGTHTYYAYIAFAASGLVLSIPYILTRHGSDRLVIVMLFLMCVFSLAMALYYSWASDFQPQGRYLASGLVPFFAFVAGGYDWLATFSDIRISGKIAKSSVNSRGKHFASASVGTTWASVFPTILLVCYVLLFLHVARTVIIPSCMQGILWNVA